MWDLEGVGTAVEGVVDADAVHREEQRLRDAVLDRGDTACRRLSDTGVELKLHGSGGDTWGIRAERDQFEWF